MSTKFLRKLMLKFLKHYIEFLVSGSLKERNIYSNSLQEDYDFARNNFRQLKTDIQDSVADGYRSAANKFAGEDQLDYICTIVAVPDHISKMSS